MPPPITPPLLLYDHFYFHPVNFYSDLYLHVSSYF